MKFKSVYLLCLSLIIFSYVKADEEEYDYDDDVEDGLSPREYHPWSPRAGNSHVFPPRPPHGFHSVAIKKTPKPSSHHKLEWDKKKISKELEKQLQLKLAALKKKQALEPKKTTTISTTTTPKPKTKKFEVKKKFVPVKVGKQVIKTTTTTTTSKPKIRRVLILRRVKAPRLIILVKNHRSDSFANILSRLLHG